MKGPEVEAVFFKLLNSHKFCYLEAMFVFHIAELKVLNFLQKIFKINF